MSRMKVGTSATKTGMKCGSYVGASVGGLVAAPGVAIGWGLSGQNPKTYMLSFQQGTPEYRARIAAERAAAVEEADKLKAHGKKLIRQGAVGPDADLVRRGREILRRAVEANQRAQEIE